MKKKILFVINTLGGAGAEAAMIELMKRLNPEKYELSLYVLTGQGEMIHKVPEYVKLLNENFCDESVLSKAGRRMLGKTVWHAIWKRGTVFRRFSYLMGNFWEMLKKRQILPDKLLWRILADAGMQLEETYDLAISFLEGGAAYYVADFVKAKRKAAFIHIDYGRSGYTRKLDQDCYLSFDRIFTVSGEVKECFLQAYPECASQTDIFHNLLDMETILARSKETGGFSDNYKGTRILTVGRLTIQKAYEIAIDAMKLVKEAGYDARWYVLGEGDQRPMLEKKIRQLGLEKDFLLMGAVENPFPWYAQTDLYVHATRFEGKSIAIQEAQVLGCAIIASDCSGNREQVLDGADGYLCELSPEAIRDKILDLVDHPEKRKCFGDAAREKIRNQKEDLDKLLSLL